MALSPFALKELNRYVNLAARNGIAPKAAIREAVVLTQAQRIAIVTALSRLWGRVVPCPTILDLRPQHAFNSRIGKDGYSQAQLIEWFVLGCSDVAEVQEDQRGRPRLVVANVRHIHRSCRYTVVVPIRSNSDGTIYVDDVIPEGLPPVTFKK